MTALLLLWCRLMHTGVLREPSTGLRFTYRCPKCFRVHVANWERREWEGQLREKA